MNLKERRAAEFKAARDIVDTAKATGRDLTPEQSADLEGRVAAVKSLDAQIAKATESANLLGQLDVMAAGAAGQVVDGKSQRLGLYGKAGGRLASKLAAKMAEGNQIGVKALATTGQVVVGQEFDQTPIALGQPAQGLLDLFPVAQHGSPEYSFLRQTTRTNNAAVVADGAQKPTSVYTVERIEQALKIVAHLSEGIPRYWLSDNAAVQSWLTTEMVYGLRVAVESLLVTTLNATSGVQTHAFATDAITTLRGALTKLETLGLEPAAYAINPLDWQAIELARTDTAGQLEMVASPVDRAQRRLWGIPVAVTTAVAAGTAYAFADDSVIVDTDTTGVQLQWSENVGTDFEKNLVRSRVEGRYNFSVARPLGVVKATVTAG
ncbi:phage major capsid protein [Rhodococcus jostii]|uniref:phage major capsid protein n=1 Tax=Rhodococcus jostii TaxID=132919 RepID=UPI00363D3598